MIAAGIAAVRNGEWSGWQQWLPLVLGIWLFVPTMPALFLEGDVARLALMGWALALRRTRVGAVAAQLHRCFAAGSVDTPG